MPHGVEMGCSLPDLSKFQLHELIKCLLLSSAPRFGVVCYAAEDLPKSPHHCHNRYYHQYNSREGSSKQFPFFPLSGYKTKMHFPPAVNLGLVI